MRKSWLRFAAERAYWGPGETGISSNAMVREAIWGDPVDDWDYPRDFGDLWRCRLAYRRAPLSLKRKMLPRLQAYRQHIREGVK